MRRTLAALIVSLLPGFPALPALPTHPAHSPQDFLGASSELVVLPVVVTDKHGGFVTDLTKDAFTVYDNGRRMPIDVFSSDDTPVTVGLVIDASGSMRAKIGEVIAAAMSFVRLSNPDDEFFAVRFNDDVRPVTTDPLATRLADADAIRQALRSIRPDGRTALYDGLIDGLDRLDAGTRPRKVLILISDGGDNASVSARDAVLERARRSNAAIYTIGLFDELDPDRNPRLLKQLARETGGERYLPASAGPLLSACDRIAREIRAGYTIGYAPPDRDGAFHRVRVEVKPAEGRRVDVRTRPGYFAAGRATQP
jgi:Ca-activated chloride channel homolog